eukprot:gene9985-biopygen4750
MAISGPPDTDWTARPHSVPSARTARAKGGIGARRGARFCVPKPSPGFSKIPTRRATPGSKVASPSRESGCCARLAVRLLCEAGRTAQSTTGAPWQGGGL